MLDVLFEIKELLIIIFSLILGIIALFKKLSNVNKLKNKAIILTEIESVIKTYIGIAEKYMNYNGEEKKEWVKTKVNQYAIENEFDYSEEITDGIIENLIMLTKTVNKREKDKEKLL